MLKIDDEGKARDFIKNLQDKWRHKLEKNLCFF